jgi:hypothetical protein
LEDGEKCDGESVEIGRWGPLGKVELTTKELHPKESKDEDEEEEQEQKRDDGPHRV